MRRLAWILLLSCIPGTFIVRTYRLRHSDGPLTVEGQYILDKIESDDGVLYHAPWGAIESAGGEEPERLETILTRFSALTGLQVVVRWDALAKHDIQRETAWIVPHLRYRTPQDYLDEMCWASTRGHPLAVRCRHRIVEISTSEDFESDIVCRRYPVSDLIGKEDGLTPQKVLFDFGYGAFGRSYGRGVRVQLNDGVLEVWGTLEDHVRGYERFQRLRKQARQKHPSPRLPSPGGARRSANATIKPPTGLLRRQGWIISSSADVRERSTSV
jgi:hypothetical protein